MENNEDNNKEIQISLDINISFDLLSKLINPSLEYTGEQLKEGLVFLKEILVPSAFKYAEEKFESILFRGTHVFNKFRYSYSSILLFNDNSFAPVNYNDNFYKELPPWTWPLGRKNDNDEQYLMNKVLPDNGTICDKKYFITLLSQSLSLDKNLKIKVLNYWPNLSQFQVDSLIEIFEDEKVKFQKLYIKYPESVNRVILETLITWSKVLHEEEMIAIDTLIFPALSGDIPFRPFNENYDF